VFALAASTLAPSELRVDPVDAVRPVPLDSKRNVLLSSSDHFGGPFSQCLTASSRVGSTLPQVWHL